MKTHIRNALYFLLGLVGLQTSSAMACVEMYLCTDIAGESTSKLHPGCIDVLAWSWGMSNSGTQHVPDPSPGRANVQDVSVTKWIDKSTPDLLLRVASGKALAKAELLTYRCGAEGPTPYWSILMESIFVSSLSSGGSGGEDRLTENVTLNFAKVQWCYTEPDAGSETCYSFDIQQGQTQ